MALSGIQIYKLLPQTNCKECGFPTCLAFAMKLAQKGTELDKCPYVSDDAKAALDAASAPRELQLQATSPSLAIARDRYFSGVLAPAGFGDLVLAGRGQASLSMREGALDELHVQLAGVNAVDAKARFTLAGIDGDLAWTRGAATRNSALFMSSRSR